jgi:hypothetical protein
MGFIGGIIGELIQLLAGVYCVLYFGGYKTIKFKDDSQRESFEKLKSKHGKKFVYLGYFLVLLGVYGILRMLLN